MISEKSKMWGRYIDAGPRRPIVAHVSPLSEGPFGVDDDRCRYW